MRIFAPARMLSRRMFFRFLQSVLAGLAGGASFGSLLAAIHSAGPGGGGPIMGLVLGGLTGAVLGLVATLLSMLVITAVRRFSGGAEWTARRWRWTGFAVGAAVVSIVHIVDIYVL